MVALRQFFEYMGETYDIHEKFFRFSSRKFQVPKTLPKTLERSEIQRLLNAASKNFQAAGTEYQIWLALRDMCILELLFSLGLRVGEAAALNVEDYRKEDQSVLIHGKGSKERVLVSVITGGMPENQCMAADTGDQAYERSRTLSKSSGKADVCIQYRKCICKVSEGSKNQPERDATLPAA